MFDPDTISLHVFVSIAIFVMAGGYSGFALGVLKAGRLDRVLLGLSGVGVMIVIICRIAGFNALIPAGLLSICSLFLGGIAGLLNDAIQESHHSWTQVVKAAVADLLHSFGRSRRHHV